MQLWALLFFVFFAIFAICAMWVARPGSRKDSLERMMAAVNPGPRASAPVFLEGAAERGSEEGTTTGRLAFKSQFEAAAQRAGVKWGVGPTLGLAAGCGLLGGLIGHTARFSLGSTAAWLGAGLFTLLPFLYIRRKSQKFLKAFEEQLPDAIDFLARSLRVGNALTISLEMMIPETAEPLRSEFLRVTRELTLGAPLATALNKLVARVPLIELRFLAAAILLQRETGGNLGEILDKLSLSVRERLRLKGKINAASSQGRLTARVLSLLPLIVMMMIGVISPAYLHTMTDQPAGRSMLMAALVAQILGYLCMKKITNIEF